MPEVHFIERMIQMLSHSLSVREIRNTENFRIKLLFR